MSDKIIYPSIDLFLYDLKDDLGQDEASIDQNCQQFCKKIYGDLDETIFQEKYAQFQKYKNSDADAIELLEAIRTRELPSPLYGYYYPMQLGDAYALQVDYSGQRDANGNPNDIEQELDDKPFLKLKQEIIQHLYQPIGTLGQTWLVWGQLTRSSNKSQWNIEQIAQECYSQIVSSGTWNQDFIGEGSLLGGRVFELWYRPENLGLTGKEFWEKFRQESHHVLIWLLPYNQTPDDMRKQVQTVYYDLMRLCQYRHKIVWAYYKSRHQKSILKREYVEIAPSLNQSRQLLKQRQANNLRLDQLQENLANNLIKVSEYTIYLNVLESQNRTLKINLENYKARLDEMTRKYTDSDLDFLKVFSEREIYAKKYQRQIEADYANFSPGLTLLQNLNSSIQGIIDLEKTKSDDLEKTKSDDLEKTKSDDLEKTKSDRTLNTTIALAGIGLATSQIASAVIVTQPPEQQGSLAFRTQAFVGSLSIGAIAVLIAFVILRRFPR
jgi:hypothetical protein